MRSKLAYYFAFLFNFPNTRIIGKLFDADYANKTFGDILSSIEINNDELKKLLNKAGKFIMLNINTSELRTLDGKRSDIKGKAKSDKEVFYKMSSSQVLKLMEKGGKITTKIEMKPKTLTLTNGDFTLELVFPCPPTCF